MTNYIFGPDTWQGTLEIDESTLFAAGVKFIIPRLNGLDGGFYKDHLFTKQWDDAKNFIRWPYFVFNPWVNGKANFEWMMGNIPVGCKMIAADIEVAYSGITSHEYGIRVKEFVNLCISAGLHLVIYTGGWFALYLDAWPTNVDYWWARYPGWLYPASKQVISWSDLISRLEVTTWAPDYGLYKSPGPVKIWQCTADRYILPGCGLSPIDINITNMTLAQLEAWSGQKFGGPDLGLTDHEKTTKMWSYGEAQGWWK